jgi:hypothetical protein
MREACHKTHLFCALIFVYSSYLMNQIWISISKSIRPIIGGQSQLYVKTLFPSVGFE